MSALRDTLDVRQRAMLEEMGVKVWLPQAPRGAMAHGAATEIDAATETADTPRAAPTARAEQPPTPTTAATARATRPPPTPPSPDTPRRPTPTSATPPATPALPAGPAPRMTAPEALYPSAERAAQGGWLVVADMPPGSDGRHGAPFADDAGRLLDAMLRALHLQTGPAPVHLVRLYRPLAPPLADAPAAAGEAADFIAALAAAAAPLAPRVVLAMGPLAARSLCGRAEPLGRLRGQPHPLTLDGRALPLVATYPPAYLLRNGADKARAWADLCLADALARGEAPPT